MTVVVDSNGVVLVKQPMLAAEPRRSRTPTWGVGSCISPFWGATPSFGSAAVHDPPGHLASSSSLIEGSPAHDDPCSSRIGC